MSRPYASAQEAADEICRLARQALDVDLVFATRLAGDELELLAVDDGLGIGVRSGRRVPLAQTFCARALAGEGPRASGHLAGGPYRDVPLREVLGVDAYLMTPLCGSDGAATGTLCAFSRESKPVSEEDLAFLDLLGGILTREQELDRIRASEAASVAVLAASEHRYRTLINDMTDVLVVVGIDGKISYVNQAWTRLSGVPVEQMLGKDAMEHVHPDDRDMAAAHLAEVTTGVRSPRECRFLAADGTYRHVVVDGQGLFDDDGNLTGFSGILHDITDRVEADRQFRAALHAAEVAREEAERASREKSAFLSRMSHELRTPLNAILGFGQLLELSELPGEDAENVGHILKAGRHLLDLINEVLDIVRIEAGVMSMSLEPVPVAEVVSESLDLVRTAAAARRVHLRGMDHRSRQVVVADWQRLKQILVNLLSNAVKYNLDDGEVVVTCRPVPAPAEDAQADVSQAGIAHAGIAQAVMAEAGIAQAEHGWLRLSVRDTGRGIPADRLADVFTPFERLGAETGDIEGTGVGLSVTRNLVEALGGRIGVVSDVGRGTTFWVDLPGATSPEEVSVPPAEDTATSCTVMYVEDNPGNIALVRRVLARRPQIRLVCVQDGAESVCVARRLVPDLVLLDLHLPGLPGTEVLAALRGSEDARLAKVPIVVVTADLTAGTERRMLDAGATLFLPKPIDVRQLLDVLDNLVETS